MRARRKELVTSDWLRSRRVQTATIVGLTALHWPAMTNMSQLWHTMAYTGHGAFVPLFSVIVAWIQRDRLRESAGPGQLVGLLAVIAGVGLLLLGHVTHSVIVEGLSVPVTVAGIVWWMFGLKCLGRAAFSVGLLALTVLPPSAVAGAVTLGLQLFAADVAGAALRSLDIPMYQVGTTIEMSVVTLQVVEACNGLRFLMGFLVLTAAVAQVTQRTFVSKLVVTASAIPVAVLANAARVAVIGLCVHFIGPQAASGVIHDWIGKSIHISTLVPLAICVLVARRSTSAPSVRPAAITPALNGPPKLSS
jgi:exosortase